MLFIGALVPATYLTKPVVPHEQVAGHSSTTDESLKLWDTHNSFCFKLDRTTSRWQIHMLWNNHTMFALETGDQMAKPRIPTKDIATVAY